MQILIRHDDFLAKRYVLCAGNAGLEFAEEKDLFIIPYSEIKDFYITQNKRGKVYFTALYSGHMLEGQILDPKEIEPFTALLKEKMTGIISIEVRK